MRKRYENWMIRWETRLTEQDRNRIVRPLEWGLDWTRNWFCSNGFCPTGDAGSEQYLHDLNDRLIAGSDRFFGYTPPADFELVSDDVFRHATGDSKANSSSDDRPLGKGQFLRFTSTVKSPYPENNRMNARWFPAKKPADRAVLIVPQWNSDALSHNALGVIFAKLGISALRLSMPYHDVRRPEGLRRADYAVSANIARTIHATQQGVVDIRCCLDWLQQQGYKHFGIIGTSLGSCYAFLASAHDPRIRVNIFNHASTYFADVVWTGQSTRHIKAGLEEKITLDRLRKAWLAISPMSYMKKFAEKPKKSLVIYAKYDLTFLPEFSRMVIDEFQRHQLDHKAVVMPCGHYTIGQTPYKYLDGWHIGSFLYSAMKGLPGFHGVGEGA